ncbi:ABC transporter substrate-binding protein [Kitasatospora sp. NPDC056138]|uniref:peptide ABC transporter substrate-binding protein n=1 Tax=Kitasatospora sp. NPDC056138 TaxID=3345724 RepID=UPI0035D82582
MAATTVLVVAACTNGGGSGGDGGKPAASDNAPAKDGGTFRLGIVEPTAIDPYNVQESEGTLVAQNLFTGLTSVDVNGKISNALAESRTSNDDCSQWTFKIKGGTTFSNGEAVDAAAFIRGWTRAAAKDAASDVAYHLNEIDGFKELQDGSATAFKGLSAPDATTLVVNLAIKDCEFDLRTFHTVFSPVPKEAGPASNKTYNDQPIGNGPFKMEGPWQHNSKITLVRNDKYALTKAHLDRIEISILNSANADQLEYQGFQAGQFDWARLPTEQLPVAKATYGPKNEWFDWDANGMNYLLPITYQGPLKSKEARLAVSYAIDRDAIVSGVFKGFRHTATSLVPPAFKDAFQDGVCVSCVKQDKEKAKALAAQAGLTPGTKLYFGYNTGAGHDAWVQAVAQQLKDVLGLDVQIDGIPFKELLKKENTNSATGMYRAAWGADYPTPGNFLAPLLATSSIGEDPATHDATGDNRGRYSNPAFDALLQKATATKDVAERTRIYQQAEKLAIGEDQALIPLFTRGQQRVGNTAKWANLTYDFNENPTLAKVSQK